MKLGNDNFLLPNFKISNWYGKKTLKIIKKNIFFEFSRSLLTQFYMAINFGKHFFKLITDWFIVLKINKSCWHIAKEIRKLGYFGYKSQAN